MERMIPKTRSGGPPKLDYTLRSPQERAALVQKIVEQTAPSLMTPSYCQLLSDYLNFVTGRQDVKKRDIITANRTVTINKRENSWEGLLEKFQNNEDGIYSMITNDKNIIFSPKVEITEDDVKNIPGMKELREEIEKVKVLREQAKGKTRSLLLKQLIEMQKDQYVLKNAYVKPIYFQNVLRSASKIDFTDKSYVNEKGEIVIQGSFSLMVEQHVSLLLQNYSKLKEQAYGRFDSDIWCLMQDLENLIDKSLKIKYPFLFQLMVYKIDKRKNDQIRQLLLDEFGYTHTEQYLSVLWRNKIPKIIAEEARKDFLLYWYTEQEYGKWKKCSRCGQIKLAHPMFFSKNTSSKDGFYSICKECRRKKTNV